QVHARLMLALYRSGRPADALAAYRRLRLTLDEELGIYPGQELRDLEAAVLRQDPALDAPGPAAVPPLISPRVPIPAQLPPALSASEAARGFLEAFGVPVTRIPADLPGRAGLYRSLLAGKRVLVVLDNARDVEQVRPLLPGSPGSLALVTSRRYLTGLVATEG